jgi:hypothetical protein
MGLSESKPNRGILDGLSAAQMCLLNRGSSVCICGLGADAYGSLKEQ